MKKIILAITLGLCYNTASAGTPRMDDVSDGHGGNVQCVRSSGNYDAGISCNWDEYNRLHKVERDRAAIVRKIQAHELQIRANNAMTIRMMKSFTQSDKDKK